MPNNLPKVSSYGNYSSDNYGVNCLCVDLGPLEIYYSYRTIVAYRDSQDGLICSVNQWSVTTGKHLNWIQSDKKSRVPAEKFKVMLESALQRHIIEGVTND